jgi:hypothetical protein
MQNEYVAELRTLASALKGRASDGAEAAVSASLDRRIDHSIELVEHGEAQVAFEDLAQNVFEFDVAFSRNGCESFSEIGLAMGLPAEYWVFSNNLVTEP